MSFMLNDNFEFLIIQHLPDNNTTKPNKDPRHKHHPEILEQTTKFINHNIISEGYYKSILQ